MSASRGKIAVVTGASSGVGRALALGLAAQGSTVCLVARSLPRLQAVIDSTPNGCELLRPVTADLTVDSEIKQLRERLEHDFGHIDILVHSAGVLSTGPMKSASVEDFDSQYRCNVRATYLLTQALLPAIRACRGQIVFINSTIVNSSKANVGQYAASKHALKGLADSLREEVNADGVRVLTVYLGRTATPMQEKVHHLEGRPYRSERLIQPEEIAELLVNLLNTQQSTEVTEITLRPILKPLQG